MSDTDTVTVQYEVDREDVQRLIKIQENELGEIREILNLLVEIAHQIECVGQLSQTDIEDRANLDERLEEWGLENGSEDVFNSLRTLGLIQQVEVGNDYILGPIFGPAG